MSQESKGQGPRAAHSFQTLSNGTIDDQPVLGNVPLKTDLDVQRSSEISLSRSQDVPVKLWIDDLDVRFVDKSHMGQNQPEVAFRPLFRDNFNRYESALFPKDGGWLPGLEQARSGEQRQGETAEEGTQVVRTEAAAVSSGIDDGVYASSAKSFKLEGSQDEPGTVVKKFSIPERIPYCVTADNFAIVSSGEEARVERAGGGISEKENGKEVKRQKRGDDDRSGRRRGRAADRRQADSSRSGTNSLRRDAAEEPGSSKMTAGPFPSGTYYIYSFDGRLLAEYNLLGQLVRHYIYFGGRLVAEYRETEPHFYYYASDQINSTRVVTDSTGTVVYSAAHDPYGGIQKTWVNSYDPSLKFSGKEHDEESGLDYFGARYYDRAQYRFISVDPALNLKATQITSQSWNLYSYCVNSPITFFDASGKWPWPVHYNWTLAIGWIVGLPFDIAIMIATADAMVDTKYATTSGRFDSPHAFAITIFNAVSGELSRWHFPSGERLAECLQIARTTYDPRVFGQVLHVIQDSYSPNHAGSNPLFGHGLFGNEDPMNNPLEAENMAWFTLDLISDFYQRWQTLMAAIAKTVWAITLVPFIF